MTKALSRQTSCRPADRFHHHMHPGVVPVPSLHSELHFFLYCQKIKCESPQTSRELATGFPKAQGTGEHGERYHVHVIGKVQTEASPAGQMTRLAAENQQKNKEGWGTPLRCPKDKSADAMSGLVCT